MGIPIAQFAMDLLVSVGVRNIVSNVHHLSGRARAGLLALDRGSAQLTISDESSLLLGSAGGIRKALPLLGQKKDQPFYLLNADVLCDADLKGLARTHARLRSRYGVKLTLMVFRRSTCSGRYREIQFDEQTSLVTGLGALTNDQPFFVGAAVLEPDALDRVPNEGPAEFVPTILEPAIREGKAGVFVSSGEWHDVGSSALWLEAHFALMGLLETRPPLLWLNRVESVNKRIAPGIWVFKKSQGYSGTADWVEPLYWNSLRDETARPPRSFGPRAVLYGSAGNDIALHDSIQYRGLRESFKEP